MKLVNLIFTSCVKNKDKCPSFIQSWAIVKQRKDSLDML